MKVEIMKEETYGEPTWYFLRVDGASIKCSKILTEMEEAFVEIVNNPDLLVKKQIILKSYEISVNLQEKN
jgi:hypothetical protein